MEWKLKQFAHLGEPAVHFEPCVVPLCLHMFADKFTIPVHMAKEWTVKTSLRGGGDVGMKAKATPLLAKLVKPES